MDHSSRQGTPSHSLESFGVFPTRERIEIQRNLVQKRIQGQKGIESLCSIAFGQVTGTTEDVCQGMN